MKDLRRKWTQEQQAQQQQEAEAEALRAQGRAVAKVLAEKRKQRARDLRAQIRAKEAAIRSRVQKQQQEQAALWRGAVAQVYEQHRRKLETTLLEQSRHWVRPEQLQARIEEALEHPVALFSEVIPEEPPAPDEDVSLRTREPYVRDYRRGPMFRYSPINRQ
ncbi:hypothetical protein WJX72_000911 [[Myrmecia] bisecta]|uniref:Uncharacterized protein n=1 Tax=[Myrmecia] bisecta TaxID=41462 RepID=A0AAW1QE27_9CHLO